MPHEHDYSLEVAVVSRRSELPYPGFAAERNEQNDKDATLPIRTEDHRGSLYGNPE